MAVSGRVILLLTACVAVVRATNAKQFPCPDDSVISPCTCLGYMAGTPTINISCDAISARQLETIFNENFLFPQVYETTITGSSLPSIQNGAFGNKILSILNFIDNPDLSFAGNSPFTSSSSSLTSFVLTGTDNTWTFDLSVFNNFQDLKSIRITNNPNIAVIGQDVVLTALTDLYLANNQLTQIPNLTHFSDLKRLDVSRNKIASIAPHTFDTEARIETVDMEFNSIYSLAANSMKINSFALQRVNISNNLISTIEPGAFVIPDSNPIIDLSHNYLKVLDSEVFMPLLTNMQNSDGKIILTGNPITCNCSVAWLVLEPNMLTHTDGGRCDGNGPLLTELDPAFFQQFCDGLAKLD